MSKKIKPPPKKPSKLYMVSFGDMMTALLAFFIVMNTFAQDQTGHKLHAATGSFLSSLKGKGRGGDSFGNHSNLHLERLARPPIYAVPEKDQNGSRTQRGPDDEEANDRVIRRESENFQRFLNEMEYRFKVTADEPADAQVVLDSFEKLGKDASKVLGPNATEIAIDSIAQLFDESFELEIVVWAEGPSEAGLKKATRIALEIEAYLYSTLEFSQSQKQRFSITAQPWLFVDAVRPKCSFVMSRKGE